MAQLNDSNVLQCQNVLQCPHSECHETHSQQDVLKCPHPECHEAYAQKYHFKHHLKTAHGIERNDCTRNFKCPFSCEAKAFRTNKELLSHCDKYHKDMLGKPEK